MDPSLSWPTVLVLMTILRKKRAEHTQILMSPTRPLQLQLQRPLSGPLCRGLWGLSLNIRETPSILPQVSAVLFQVP